MKLRQQLIAQADRYRWAANEHNATLDRLRKLFHVYVVGALLACVASFCIRSQSDVLHYASCYIIGINAGISVVCAVMMIWMCIAGVICTRTRRARLELRRRNRAGYRCLM